MSLRVSLGTYIFFEYLVPDEGAVEYLTVAIEDRALADEAEVAPFLIPETARMIRASSKRRMTSVIGVAEETLTSGVTMILRTL